MTARSGPHQITIGERELRQMPTAVRRLCGHFDTGPSGDAAQLNSDIRPAISLSPTNGDTAPPREGPGLEWEAWVTDTSCLRATASSAPSLTLPDSCGHSKFDMLA